MQYMLLIWDDESQWAKMSEDEIAALRESLID